jgi:hypothetical protein
MGSELQFGESDFTWALWVKTAEDCAGNKVHLGVEDDGADRTHLWLGCAVNDVPWVACPDGPAGGRAAGYFTSISSGTDGGGYCGRTVINDGAWHHLVVTKSGHASAALTLYVDGEVDVVGTYAFTAPFQFFDSPELAVGAFSRDTYQAVGVFDEVAIWLRALDPAEIQALYRRGALRLSMRARLCADLACSENPAFGGPGGDPNAALWDPPGSLVPGAALGLGDLPRARFFQYRARFESDVAGKSPALAAVTVTGAR